MKVSKAFRFYIFVSLLIGLALSPGSGSWAAQPGSGPTPLPDLLPLSLELDPPDVEPGQPATVRAVVANRGEADARSFWVVFTADGRPLGSQLLPGLAAGEEATVEAIWIATPQRQTLEVRVDSPNRVEESDEENNVLRKEIQLGADLVLTEFRWEPRFPKPGESTQIAVTITNQGTRDVEKNFALRVAVGRRTLATRFFAGLPRGASVTAEVAWRAEEGSRVLRAWVDPFDAVPEADEGNNALTRILDVSPLEFTGADLAVAELTLTPAEAQSGESVTLEAVLANEGSGAAPAFEVEFLADGEPIATRTVAGLGPGERVRVSVPWVVEAGERRLRVRADSQARIPEVDEENNVRVHVQEFGPPLNACGQYVFLDVEPGALLQLQELTGLAEEAVVNVFLPQVKRVMEEQYEGVNVRFLFRRPPRGHATILFDERDMGSTLGRAPLGRRFGTAYVFIGSFLSRRSLQRLPLTRLAVILGSVSSHELGHLFGLAHSSRTRADDIMAANADLSPYSGDRLPRFTPEALQRLQRMFPLECSS